MPVYQNWIQILIQGFLKIKYQYFSGLWYSTLENIFSADPNRFEQVYQVFTNFTSPTLFGPDVHWDSSSRREKRVKYFTENKIPYNAGACQWQAAIDLGGAELRLKRMAHNLVSDPRGPHNLT